MYEEYKDLAKRVRRNCLRMRYVGQGGHSGSMLSAADIMAVLYGGFNIRANCSCPAAIRTPMAGESSLGDPNFDDGFFRNRLTPLRRWGRPEAIANTALFLTTDGSYMNGAAPVPDGGIAVNGNVNKTPFA